MKINTNKTVRDEQARGVLGLNRTPGTAASFSGRPGSRASKLHTARSAEKSQVRRAVFDIED